MYAELIVKPKEIELTKKLKPAYSFRLFRPLMAFLCLLFMTACSGGGDAVVEDSPTEVQTVGGNATKGPLANADVSVFALDTSADNLRGAQVASGTTNSQANIVVDLPIDAAGLLVVVVTANANTTDLTTGQAPVLTRLSTIAVAAEWLDGKPVYATPLSHMAVGIAAQNIGGNTAMSTLQIRSALGRAQQVVRKTVGFNLLGNVDDSNGPIDLFTTAPVLTNNSVDASSRERTLRYRKASEAIVAVIANISGSTETSAIEAAFDSLTDDLGDGRVDDQVVAGDLATTEPENLPIPNASGLTVGDTLATVNSERTSVGVDNQEVTELVEAEDTVGQSASVDSGLTSTDLAGEVGDLSLQAFPVAAGSLSLVGEDPTQELVFEVGLGESVTVTAAASEGFKFVRWTQDGVEQSLNSSYTFSLDASSNLVAEFSANLAVAADPQTGGTPSAGQEFFEPCATVTLTANPATGFELFAWVNNEGVRPSVFDEGENLQATASFIMPENPLSLIAVYEFAALADSNTEQGEVSRTFNEDGNVLLTAIPQQGFVFVHWRDQTGQVLSTQREDFQVNLTGLDADSQIIAEFARPPAVWDQSNWDESAWQ